MVAGVVQEVYMFLLVQFPQYHLCQRSLLIPVDPRLLREALRPPELPGIGKQAPEGQVRLTQDQHI